MHWAADEAARLLSAPWDGAAGTNKRPTKVCCVSPAVEGGGFIKEKSSCPDANMSRGHMGQIKIYRHPCSMVRPLCHSAWWRADTLLALRILWHLFLPSTSCSPFPFQSTGVGRGNPALLSPVSPTKRNALLGALKRATFHSPIAASGAVGRREPGVRPPAHTPCRGAIKPATLRNRENSR